MKKSIYKLLSLVAVLLVFSECQQSENAKKGSADHIRSVTQNIDDAALKNANGSSGDWLTYGLNYSEDRYSELTQINKESISDLGLAWTMNLGTKRGIEATPLVVDGILFFTSTWSVAHAVDARTGKEIWKYDPKVPKSKAGQLCCGVVNRGMAIYKGKVIFGTLDGRLVALDAATGTKAWEVNTLPDNDMTYSITGAPRIAKGKVIIGNGGAELKVRGFVTAYDAETGEKAWRFYTVPGNPKDGYEHADLEGAAKTWSGDWWKHGGGGTVWDAIVYDEELDQVLLGVGNGTHWDQAVRSPEGGDNLYLSSVVALDPDDGSYKWHFQQTPAEVWDYTATQPITLADLEIDGKNRKVLMHAPKNGFFYVIDRESGEFISGKPYVYTNWAKSLDENGRPIEEPGARYTDGRTHFIAPSAHGGHNWEPMSFSHQTGLMYFPAANRVDGFQSLATVGIPIEEGGMGGVGGNVSLASKLYLPPVIDPNAPPPGSMTGRLVAWDPVQQKEAWGVDQPFFFNGGLLSTAGGLIFQGDAEGKLIARDAANGEAVWEYDIRSGAIAPPVTYLVDGEQYVTLLVGWGGSFGQYFKYVNRLHPGTVYTFKLGGNATAPEKLPALEKKITSLKTEASPEEIGHGFSLYAENCIGCHQAIGVGGGNIPDLTMSTDATFGSFEGILLQGMLAPLGMPTFEGLLTKTEVQNLKDFILFAGDMMKNNPAEFFPTIGKYQYMADEARKKNSI